MNIKLKNCFIKKQLVLLLLYAFVMEGCVYRKVWYNPSKTIGEVQQDMYNAQLEAKKHGHIQSSSYGNPISSGISAGIEQAIREKEIMNAYMKAKGYRLVSRKKIEKKRGKIINL